MSVRVWRSYLLLLLGSLFWAGAWHWPLLVFQSGFVDGIPVTVTIGLTFDFRYPPDAYMNWGWLTVGILMLSYIGKGHFAFRALQVICLSICLAFVSVVWLESWISTGPHALGAALFLSLIHI